MNIEKSTILCFVFKFRVCFNEKIFYTVHLTIMLTAQKLLLPYPRRKIMKNDIFEIFSKPEYY